MLVNLFGPNPIAFQRTNLDTKCIALLLLSFLYDVGKALCIADDCLVFGFFYFKKYSYLLYKIVKYFIFNVLIKHNLILIRKAAFDNEFSSYFF